jgi:NAD(P)-dependent dehydrogenase (short-subunit alcohol dehydrogenase family)
MFGHRGRRKWDIMLARRAWIAAKPSRWTTGGDLSSTSCDAITAEGPSPLALIGLANTTSGIQRAYQAHTVLPLPSTTSMCENRWTSNPYLKNSTIAMLNIASTAAKSGAPYAATYSGTKAGLAEWSRALRLELSGTGVRFSTVFPGYVREVGMFAKFGVQSPWIVGLCAPSQVARAVVVAVEKGSLNRS